LGVFKLSGGVVKAKIKIIHSNGGLLALADDFRALRWEEMSKYPEIVLNQVKELVGRC